MSVILKEPNGSIVMYIKGADNIIFQRTKQEYLNSEKFKNLKDILDSYAREGLRTLLLAKRTLDPQEFKSWSIQYEDAKSQPDNREEIMAS